MRAVLPLALILGLANVAAADDAYWSAVGGAGNFGKSKDIRMVSEVVQITLKHASMHVHATFNFQNDGAAQTVTMAFPETMEDYKQRRPGDAIAITAFKSWVDGKPVPVTRKAMPLKDLDENAQYSAVWLKQVPFEGKGKRQVVCDYEAEYSQGRDYFDSYYILRSGATWKGDIGDCLIHVDWSQLKGQGSPVFNAADAPIMGVKGIEPARQGPHWAEFHFKNLKPKFDLQMDWMNRFWNVRVNGKSPSSLPIDFLGDSEISGNPRDPILVFPSLTGLLGTDKEAEEAADGWSIEVGPLRRIRLHGRVLVSVRSGLLRINGHTIRVRKVARTDNWPKVYLQDVIAVLHGTYRYDPVTEQADISIRW